MAIWHRENATEASHPKTLELIKRAGFESYYRMHMVRQYCAEHETGGYFSDATCAVLHVKPKHLEAMLAVGLVDNTGENPPYVVHNWRQYNPTDPTNAARQARYRNAKRNAQNRYGNGDTTQGPKDLLLLGNLENVDKPGDNLGEPPAIPPLDSILRRLP